MKLNVLSLSRNSPNFIELHSSLPYSQVPVTCPYPEPARYCPQTHIPLPEYPSYYYPPIYAWVSQEVFYSQVSPSKPVCASSLPLPATCHVHLILLDFITCTILGKQYRSLSSSLCGFLHSLVISYLLGQNILLNIIFSESLSSLFFPSVSDQVSHHTKQRAKS